MLHLTSLVQNASRSNTPHSKLEHLKRLNKNRSFVYNSQLDRYEYLYNNVDNEEQEGHLVGSQSGFFGCFRDKHANSTTINNNNASNNNSKELVWWGQIKDTLYIEDDLEKEKEAKKTTKKFHEATTQDELETINRPQPIFYFEPDTELNPSIKNPNAVAQIQVQTKPKEEKDNLKKDQQSKSKKLVYDLKSSQFKIEASRRDAMKILIQNLEDREHQLEKRVVKKFDDLSNINHPNIKRVNFLHFSNKTNPNPQSDEDGDETSRGKSSLSTFFKANFQLIKERANLDNFKSAFNVLSRLNKSINIFNGDFNLANLDKNLDHVYASFFNVNAAQSDLNGLLYNNNSKMTSKVEKWGGPTPSSSTTISLCSNIYDKSQRPFGYSNHSTMLFEHNRVKIGFMALVDQSFYNRLNRYLSENNKHTSTSHQDQAQAEYVDFVDEANRLAKQLRLSGAHLIVALINFDNDEVNEARLLAEANDLDLVFSSQTNKTNNDSSSPSSNTEEEQTQPQPQQAMNFKKVNDKWIVKSANNFDSISLVSLQIDESKSNKIVDIEFTKYHVEA